MPTQSFYIIDGHAQIYRAYFAPFRDLTSPSCEPTKAPFVFTQMLGKSFDDIVAVTTAGVAVEVSPQESVTLDGPNPQQLTGGVPLDLVPQIEAVDGVRLGQGGLLQRVVVGECRATVRTRRSRRSPSAAPRRCAAGPSGRWGSRRWRR